MSGFDKPDLAWDLAGLFDYQPWKHVSLLFGYRYMSIDYDTSSVAFQRKVDRFKV
jgi:hypothetical protein